MVRAGESIPDNLEFSLHMKKLQEGGMEQLKNLIDNRPELKFIIIDTLGRVRKTSSGGNAYEIDTDLIGEVQELCKAHKISILLLHHTKKIKESDYIDDCSGSTGITGSVDTILKLSRNRNEKDATLQVTGRDIIKEQELAIQFNDISLSWELLGDAEEFRMSKERKEIIDILKDGQPHKVKEISEKLGKTYNAVKFLCWKLDNEGYIYNLNGYGYVINNNNNNSFTANLANPANLANLANPANPVDKVSGLAIDTNTANPKNTSVYKEMTDKVSRVSKVSDSSQLEDNFNREEVPF
jgi:DNA-binding Lrp family transcriptional regulator